MCYTEELEGYIVTFCLRLEHSHHFCFILFFVAGPGVLWVVSVRSSSLFRGSRDFIDLCFLPFRILFKSHARLVGWVVLETGPYIPAAETPMTAMKFEYQRNHSFRYDYA